jgi:hypothetical protein
LYRITVRGAVPTSWTDRLGGLRVVADAHEISTLEGPLADQAALAGVLDTLCALGLPILELKTVSVPTTTDDGKKERKSI